MGVLFFISMIEKKLPHIFTKDRIALVRLSSLDTRGGYTTHFSGKKNPMYLDEHRDYKGLTLKNPFIILI